MRIIITTNDPNAQRFVEETVRDGEIGWGCSVECESTGIEVETIVSFDE